MTVSPVKTGQVVTDTLATGSEQPSMIWSNLTLFSMCFPYGIKSDVETGQGVIIRLRVELKEAAPE